MHRNGSGDKITDLAAAMQQWRAEGKSPSTYCSLREFRAFTEDFGELVLTLKDGRELRQHATLKDKARGGTPTIRHNRVIIGRDNDWTHWPATYLDTLIKRHQDSPGEVN